MSLPSRWPVLKALRNRIRRIFRVASGQRKLKMQVLESDRLVLRKLDQHDLGDIIAWEEVPGAQNAEVEAREFLDYCFREYRERGIGPWGMQLKETGAIVGNCGFPEIALKNLCGEVNYYVAPRHRGQGLAPEALQTLLKFGFRDIGLTRIQARCEPDNLNSERVMQKAGMKFEGWIQSAPVSKASCPKEKLYAILGKDFNLLGNGLSGSASPMPAQSDDHGQGAQD
jgi:[ribosomal protein S5]-alanine N-acetyltransferase